MLPRMLRINSVRDFGPLVIRHNQRTCPMSHTNHRTCPTDSFPADKFLSMPRPYTRSDMSAETGPRTSFSGHVWSCVRGLAYKLQRIVGQQTQNNVIFQLFSATLWATSANVVLWLALLLSMRVCTLEFCLMDFCTHDRIIRQHTFVGGQF